MKRIFSSLLLLVCNLSFGQVNLNQGLKAYYPFTGNANDVSGNGYNGVPQGNIQLTSDRFGNANSAYQFDGIDDRIIIAANEQLYSPAFSICYYFKTESSNLQVCVGKINYADGNAATFNSGVYPTGPNAFFGTMNSLNNCSLQVPTTYTYTIYSSTIINLNQWYCVVNTFENGIEKMYLDGVLINQTSLPFNDATNCSNTNILIGSWWQGDPYRFKGEIDDVRYYDRAINENEVRALCTVTNTSDTSIINEYTPVLALDICNNTLDVGDASKYNKGDTVLLIQMKGASIDSSNTASFGTITDYKNAGNYEFNIIKEKNGNALSLLNILEREYDIPDGKVQLIRVPYYDNLSSNSVLTCLPWDGSKGGVLVVNVANSLELNANIDVSAKGFNGGKATTNPDYTCDITNFIIPTNDEANAALKGEGIFRTSTLLRGRGKLANGGGGGNSTNSGGAGGGNGGLGGDGGKQFAGCTNSTIYNGGIPGVNLDYSNPDNKIFLGGGGGAGHMNDVPALSSGGNGGGIAIINCTNLISNGFSINSDGETPIHKTGTNDDGKSGAGAGGTVLLNYSTNIGDVTSSIKGGNGDYCTPPGGERHGPGGGGGGGVFWVSQPVKASDILVDMSGGMNGVNTNLGNDAWGATPGSTGKILTSLILPVATTPFKKNIDSVRINETVSNCTLIDFAGLAYIQSNPVKTWLWKFGDGNTSNVQNTSHNYTASGTYNAALIITDIDGCMDSILKKVIVNNIDVTTNADTALCGSSPVKLSAKGGSGYSWFPATGLDNPTSSNPMATPLVTTKYFVTVSNGTDCTKKDSVTISVNSYPDITVSNDTSICIKTQAPLLATGGSSYNWAPSAGLNNPNIANPIASPSATTTYNVSVTNPEGCTKTDMVTIAINPVATITKSGDTTICNKTSVEIFAGGGQTYSWLPASSLNDPSIASPMASPLLTTVYQVRIADEYGCVYNESVKISVRDAAKFSVSRDTSICTQTSFQLLASGGDTYIWSPSSFLSDPNTNNPIATANTSIEYSVTIKENICNESATLFTKITALPLPDIQASKSNDITCSFPSSQLLVSGAQNYTWLPATDLSNPSIANPVASPTVSTNYIVTGKSVEGCVGSTSIRVEVSPYANVIYELPNSFTPNGDGKNDCFGVAYWGVVQKLDFSIYNRFGQRVFHTDNVSVCWDGKFKGEPQDTNAYVYTIKATTACGNIDRKGVVMLLK